MDADKLIAEVCIFVEQNIGEFHQKRQESLEKLKLDKLLKRKNPYLFKAKHVELAQDLVRLLLDAHLSSQEETIFGGFLEDLAIYVNQLVYAGRKSSAIGIDLEFDFERKRYLVSIKSGPYWANASQKSKMRDNFKRAAQILRQREKNLEIIAVNGCCYGQDNKPDKGDYWKYCGQQFWEFISGRPEFFVAIVEPLGHKAREKNENFFSQYNQIVNRFTKSFADEFCVDGRIDWERLVRFNSGQNILIPTSGTL